MQFEPPPYIQKPIDVAEVRYLLRAKSTETIAAQPSPSRNTQKKEKPIYVSEIQPRDWFEALPIVSMTLPHGPWLLEKLPTGPYAYNVSLKKSPSITINFGSGGDLEGENSQFRKILSREPSHLTSDEIAYFYPSGSFVSGHSEDLNGKRVIVFEGHFKEKNLDMYQLEFNHNPDMSGVCVQAVITFSAPPSQYKKHIKAFKAALKTIRWIHKVEIDPSKE